MLIRTLIAAIVSVLLALSASAQDILISDLSDLDFGRVSPTSGELSASISVCVSLDQAGRYSVVGRGDGPAGTFVLNNGIADIAVDVFFSDRRNRRGVRLEPGVALSDLRGKKRRRRRNCNRPNARVDVLVSAADLLAAGSGIYRGTLAFTVTPQ